MGILMKGFNRFEIIYYKEITTMTFTSVDRFQKDATTN